MTPNLIIPKPSVCGRFWPPLTGFHKVFIVKDPWIGRFSGARFSSGFVLPETQMARQGLDLRMALVPRSNHEVVHFCFGFSILEWWWWWWWCWWLWCWCRIQPSYFTEITTQSTTSWCVPALFSTLEAKKKATMAIVAVKQAEDQSFDQSKLYYRSTDDLPWNQVFEWDEFFGMFS